jgi:hypothetical protein
VCIVCLFSEAGESKSGRGGGGRREADHLSRAFRFILPQGRPPLASIASFLEGRHEGPLDNMLGRVIFIIGVSSRHHPGASLVWSLPLHACLI